MSSKRNHSPKTKTDAKCDKCGAVACAPPGKKHRRCPGQADAPIRSKHDALPGKDRGRWS